MQILFICGDKWCELTFHKLIGWLRFSSFWEAARRARCDAALPTFSSRAGRLRLKLTTGLETRNDGAWLEAEYVREVNKARLKRFF